MKYYLAENRHVLTEATSLGLVAAPAEWNDPRAIYDSGTEGALFWSKYANACWGTDSEAAKIILTLGDAFKQEVLKLGFSSDENPFIAFLIYVLSASDDASKAIKAALISKPLATYNSIHNAFTNKLIDEPMLRHMSSSLGGTVELPVNNNVFWMPALYTYSPADFTEYLTLQRSLITKTWGAAITPEILKKFKGTDDDAKKVAVVSNVLNSTNAALFKASINSAGKTTYFAASSWTMPDGSIDAAGPGGKLRNTGFIDILVEEITGEKGGTKAPAISPTEAKIYNDVLKAKFGIDVTRPGADTNALKKLFYYVRLSAAPADYTEVINNTTSFNVQNADGTITDTFTYSSDIGDTFSELPDITKCVDAFKAYDMGKSGRITILKAIGKAIVAQARKMDLLS